MDGVAVIVAALLGAAGGYLSGPVADAVGVPRYGAGAPDHDPEDAALAPLDAPTSVRQRLVLAGLGAAGLAGIAAGAPAGEVLVLLGVLYISYLAAMVVDLQYLRLPNLFTYGAAVVAVAGAAALSDGAGLDFAGAWLGALIYSGFLFATRVGYQLVRGREGMGLGDVKLAISLGASIGWLGTSATDPADPTWLGAVQLVIYAALLGNLLGAVGGLLLVRKVDREFPFGPALVAGWVVIVACSQQLLT